MPNGGGEVEAGEEADVRGANSSPLEASKEPQEGEWTGLGAKEGREGGQGAWLPTYLGQAAEWLVGE